MPCTVRQRDGATDCLKMELSWQKMYKADAKEGKALLLLVLRIRQRFQEFTTPGAACEVDFRRMAADARANFAEHATLIGQYIFDSHVVCADKYLEERAYLDTLKHTGKAIEVSRAHGDAWMHRLVTWVLWYEKQAWMGLGERTKYLDAAKRWAQAMARLPNLAGHDRVNALCELATVQIDFQEFQAAITTARQAVGVEDVPPASRNHARAKLGVALLGARRGEEARRELERCASEWTMSGKGTKWSTNDLKRDKAVLDRSLEKLRGSWANGPGDDIVLSKKYTAMTQTWERMCRQELPDGKAMLALALQIRQRGTEELKKSARVPANTPEIAFEADRILFDSHTACACDCEEAGAYQDALEHTKEALALSEENGGAWRYKVVMAVLNCEKEAWRCLGERTKYLDATTRRARAMVELPSAEGHERVDALCEVATIMIDRDNYAGAVACSRKALTVDAPQVSRNYARLKLGIALMSGGVRYRMRVANYADRNLDKALRELERCDREWTTAIEDTTWCPEQLKRLRQSVDNNLRACRGRMAQKSYRDAHPHTSKSCDACDVGAEKSALPTSTVDVKELLESAEKVGAGAPRLAALSMDLFTAGDVDGATGLAERAAGLALKTAKLPSFDAHAFTLANCFLHDDHRAAERLACVREALRLRERQPLDDTCPICLQPIDWPVMLKEGARVTIHGLKKAAHHNGAVGIVKRAPAGPDRRAEVSVLGRSRTLLEKGKTVTVKVRTSNLVPFDRHVEAPRCALITGCMHVYHARCIKRAVDEGLRTCPVCQSASEFDETPVECTRMPPWDRPSDL